MVCYGVAGYWGEPGFMHSRSVHTLGWGDAEVCDAVHAPQLIRQKLPWLLQRLVMPLQVGTLWTVWDSADILPSVRPLPDPRLIHMSGDYPMTEYPVKVRLVHACGSVAYMDS